eukprot:320457-Amphidinium_carterae.1
MAGSWLWACVDGLDDSWCERPSKRGRQDGIGNMAEGMSFGLSFQNCYGLSSGLSLKMRV